MSEVPLYRVHVSKRLALQVSKEERLVAIKLTTLAPEPETTEFR